MKAILIQSAVLVFPSHPLHKQKIDLLIDENGIIEEISQKIERDTSTFEVINGNGKYLMPGFLDLNANFGEPGLETKEDIVSGCKLAAHSGFTAIAIQPNTKPAIQSRAEVMLVLKEAQDNLVDIHPIGAISKNRKGEELTEMYDMYTHGALAFTDGNRSVQQAGLMSRALLYSKGFGARIFSYAKDDSIASGHMVNEGVMSTYLGMKGNPNLSEAIMVSRDLFLAEYNNAPIHFSTISTKEAIELIRQAKSKGLPVTCDVSISHLYYNDSYIEEFDSLYKIDPPLRSEEDRLALITGLKDGTIDAIVSQHTPHEIEYKQVEFQVASYGIASMQTLLPLALQLDLDLELLVEKLSINPRKVLGLPAIAFEKGSAANVVLLDTEEEWTFGPATNQSKSKNNPLYGTAVKGKAVVVINNNKIVYNY